jgi:hypothetical protein
METTSQDRRSPDRDFNRGPPKYEGVLPTLSRHSVPGGKQGSHGIENCFAESNPGLEHVTNHFYH